MTDPLKQDLEAWCQRYVDAFNARNVERIADHWAFPALIVQAQRNFAFESRQVFQANVEPLLRFYDRQGVVRIERDLDQGLRLNSLTASMKVSDRMYDAQGRQIVSWEAGYTLRSQGEDWYAVLGVADGESAAWAARGTPLGS